MAQDTPAAVAARRVVYTLPGEDAVCVTPDLPYTSSTGSPLPFDLYLPPPAAGGPPWPVVVLVTGYGDAGLRRVFGCAAREMGAFRSWARLLAASGMAAVAYETAEPVGDGRAVLDCLRTTGPSLGLDTSRIGVWSCSGHGPTALGVLLDEPGVACGALLYSYLLDVDGHSEAAEAAAIFRFATPAAGRAPADLRDDRPLLLVRAGRDEMPGLTASFDRFVAEALRANRSLSFVNAPTAPHAFDLVDDTAATHHVIQGVIDFLAARLIPAHLSAC